MSSTAALTVFAKRGVLASRENSLLLRASAKALVMIVLSLLEKLERKTSSVILIDLRNVDQRDHARLCFSCVLLVFAFLRAVSPAEMREMSLSLEAGGIS